MANPLTKKKKIKTIKKDLGLINPLNVMDKI